MAPHLTLALVACLAGAEPTCGVKPGDILLFKSGGRFKLTLYALGGSPGVTHAGIVVARPDGTLAILEAPGLNYPVMLSDVGSRHQQYPGPVWVRSLRRPLTPEQSRCLTAFACAQEGKAFFPPGFLLPAFGHPIVKRGLRCLTKEQLNPARWFCSPLVIVAGVTAGLIDPCKVRPKFTDPEDLFTDRMLDLSACWEKPVEWPRCGPQAETWWSRSCHGEVECWR